MTESMDHRRMQDLLMRGQVECNKSWREYIKAGYKETKGTVMMIPPSEDELKEAFTRPHKETTMTVGARALCKHHARKSNHPFWSQPSGSLAAKNRLAEKHLEQIMKEANWKNIFRLHRRHNYIGDAREGRIWNEMAYQTRLSGGVSDVYGISRTAASERSWEIEKECHRYR